ncbi:MAG: endonuclease, partial [Coprobacillus sp.]|nr:endonuclease [Coprobacillus sp.]
AFYFESISLVYYTNVDSSSTGDTGDTGGNTGDTGDMGGDTGGSTGGDTGGNTGDPEIPGEEETDEYTYYQNYSYKFAQGDLSSSGGTLTKNGLTWTYGAPTYIGWDGQYKRGIQIGSKDNPQYEPWTFTTNFDETIKLMDVTVYLYTTTSGNANVSVSLGEQEIGSEDFNTTSTSSTAVYLAEYTELECLGDSLSITFKANNAAGFYLKAISLHIYTTVDTELNLSADSLEDAPYEPAPVVPGENDVLKTNSSYNLSKEDYYTYNSVDWTLTGEELRTSLRDSYSPVTRYSYGNIRYMLPYVDEDPNNEGYMYGAYDGDELPAYWDSEYYDREHVWPCSHMRLIVDEDGDYRPDNNDTGHYSDLHNLRICCKPVNNYKSDKHFYTTNDSYNFFPNESNPSSLGSGSHSFSPAECYDGDTGDHRGDVARICLYMYTMYEELSLGDGLTGTDNPYTFGQLKTLLMWNAEDAPDDFEIQRNNRIYEYQGNRNPFVDYPELADYLFPNETHYFLSY